MAYGALRRENRTPDDVIIRWSAAAADQHFKVLIVIEPNLDRVWAALMAGAQPGRTPFTVVQLATSGLDDAPKVRSVILRSADAERGAVSFFTDLRSAKKSKRCAASRGFLSSVTMRTPDFKFVWRARRR